MLSEWEKAAVLELLRGTAIENDEAELAQLKKLPLEEQIEVGFVLRAATFEYRNSKQGEISKLARVRSVDDALRFLYPVGFSAHKKDRSPVGPRPGTSANT